MTLGCFWEEWQKPAWVVHRFPVTTQASLASELTSLGTEHTLKGNRALSNPTLRASTPATWEQNLPLTEL